MKTRSGNIALAASFIFTVSLSCLISDAYGERGVKETTTCAVRVYVADPDPNGLNVRSGPSGDAEIIGVIPTSHPAVAGTMLYVNKARNGWLWYSHFEHVLDEGPPFFPVPASGWVHGSLVRVDPQANAYGRAGGGLFLYAKPRTQSRKLFKLTDKPIAKFSITSCRERWIEVALQYEGEGRTASGWLHPDDYCGHAVTTCP